MNVRDLRVSAASIPHAEELVACLQLTSHLEEHSYAFYLMSGLSVVFAGVFSMYAIRRSGLCHLCSLICGFLPNPWLLPDYARFAKWGHYQIASRHLSDDHGYLSLYVVGQPTIGCDTSMTR